MDEENISVDVKYSPVRGFFKLAYIIVLSILLVLPLVYIASQKQFLARPAQAQVIASYPVRMHNIQGVGQVSEPVINVRVKKPEGYEDFEFLVDSGAVISSYPYEMAEELKVDLAFLPRLAFKGYGNTSSFAYQGNTILNIGDIDISVPVVFTESKGSRFLLGRKGFFDEYTIKFNHDKQTVEIIK